jgi:DNA processing protein
MTAITARHAVAAALAALPGIGPARLRTLCADDCERSWALVREGRGHCFDGISTDHARQLADAARTIDLATTSTALSTAGCTLVMWDDADYPERLREDPDPPVLLWLKGPARIEAGPTVGIVGTRRASPVGRAVAEELGRDLTAAGVGVVSGLALGIDGAAHRGALAAAEDTAARPIAVVGSGLDRPYPADHGTLWRRVGEVGLLVSETPLGHRPEPWRFPARNRIIAALSDVLVVVESHDRGGSLHTVREAMLRGVTVMAVPGSVRSSSASGTNALIADGCPVVRGVDDVLTALGLHTIGSGCAPPPLSSVERQVLDALGGGAANVDDIIATTGLGLAVVAAAVVTLTVAGWVRTSGSWLAPAPRPPVGR